MKRLCCTALLAVLLWSSIALAVSDDFARGDASPLSGSWASSTAVPTTLQIVNQRVRGVSANFGGEIYTGTSGLTDSQASITIVTQNGQGNGQIILRDDGSDQYVFQCGSTLYGEFASIIFINGAGGFFVLANNSSPCGASDRITGEATGQTLNMYRGGILIAGPVANATLDSGSCGISLEYPSSPADVELDDFECHSTVAGGSPARFRASITQ